MEAESYCKFGSSWWEVHFTLEGAKVCSTYGQSSHCPFQEGGVGLVAAAVLHSDRWRVLHSDRWRVRSADSLVEDWLPAWL
eukprot:5963965-Amphidinium_carterae.1